MTFFCYYVNLGIACFMSEPIKQQISLGRGEKRKFEVLLAVVFKTYMHVSTYQIIRVSHLGTVTFKVKKCWYSSFLKELMAIFFFWRQLSKILMFTFSREKKKKHYSLHVDMKRFERRNLKFCLDSREETKGFHPTTPSLPTLKKELIYWLLLMRPLLCFKAFALTFWGIYFWDFNVLILLLLNVNTFIVKT